MIPLLVPMSASDPWSCRSHGKLIIFERAGHMNFPETYPDLYQQAVAEFLLENRNRIDRAGIIPGTTELQGPPDASYQIASVSDRPEALYRKRESPGSCFRYASQVARLKVDGDDDLVRVADLSTDLSHPGIGPSMGFTSAAQ